MVIIAAVTVKITNTATNLLTNTAAAQKLSKSSHLWILDYVFYHNSVKKWLIALAVTIGVMILLSFVKRIVHSKLSKFAAKTKTSIDDFITEVISKTKFFFFFFIGIYFGSKVLNLPVKNTQLLGKITIVILLIQVAIWVNHLITILLEKYRKLKMLEENASARASISAISFISKLLLWIIITGLILDNLGFDITTLVAGLGVGGIAVALAAQNILGDLFASFLIVLDKPFVIGDFVIVDNFMGVIENVGLKTTRIRSLGGEQLIFANSDLLKSRIRNYKRMTERRVVFGFGVTYQTSYEKLQKIPDLVKEIIVSVEDTRFDRAHFAKYNDSSLDFEVVYYCLTPDYNKYMDMQQKINLDLFKRFEQDKVDFAYPTQTVYIEKS
ncbi:MAG: mechanosensitive ion channel family protein [Spirochaetes bacterium]|nr:mechanosensitive ion channel family protein [Spirochaetota bacterium]